MCFYIGVFLAQNVIQISEHFKAENGKIALLVCLLLLAFRPGATLHSVIKELNDGTAQIYATACDDRYRQMEAMAQGDTLYTTELPRSKIFALMMSVTIWKTGVMLRGKAIMA